MCHPPGTLGPFSLLVYAFRRWLLRWSFWLALACCLSVHIILIWIIFEYVLASIENLSIWLWLPVMLVETLILLVAVKRIEESLTGRHENIKLTL